MTKPNKPMDSSSHPSFSTNSLNARSHKSDAVVPVLPTLCFRSMPVWAITRTASPSAKTGRVMFSST